MAVKRYIGGEWITISGLQGPEGETGPIGPTGDSGFVAQTDPPTNTDVLWLDTDDSAAPVISPTIIDAAGDLIYGSAADAVTRLGIGTAGQVLKVNSGATAPEWGVDPTTDVVTTAGDLLYGTAADAVTRLGIGTAGQVLTVNTGATAPEWVTLSTISPTIIDAKGDLIVGSAADTIVKLTVGANEHRLVANSGTTSGLSYVADTTNYAIAAKGDLLVGTAADTVTNLTIGNDNTVLVADSATTSGVKWTNNISVENVQISVQTDLNTTGTVNLDFSTEGFKSHSSTLTGDITYTASNYAAGRSITIRVPNGATQRTLTFPTNWKFVGTKPANIAANKVGILTVTSFSNIESACVAAWAVEA